ncbi:MAG: AAA family ATPase [Streptosporangiaceae bacterium]|nr:AAA family ATPase [Streptosporangiaceae bacterium]
MSGRASSPVLVGRSEQLAALEDALHSVHQGTPAAVLLGGEAGLGKSRLVAEFGGAAQAAGIRVLIGGCLELGTDGLPFAPFTAVLRDLVGEMGAEGVAEMLPGRTTRELARLLPELGEPDAGSDPGEARARLFEGLLSALQHLTMSSPVLLVIEDAHWADQSSRDLLTFLIGNQRAISGLLIIVTFRSDELHRTHPLRPLLATLDRIDWVERIELPRLTRQDTSELTARILGRELADDLADALYRRSQGNPLFVEALVCCDGHTSRELPESLRDLLLAGVRRLPEDTQEVLGVASAGGAVTSPALLAAVSGLDEAALSRVLRPAVTGNVLRARADGYAFRHELIREAVHEDLLPGEHGRLHSRFAEAIDADPALVPPGRAAVEMAHHWYSAHDASWALTAAWQAAAQAGRAVAPAERLTLLARVLELWDQVPDAAERIDADHVRVLEDAVAAAEDAEEHDRLTALAGAALKELDPEAEPIRAALLLSRRGHAAKHLGHGEPARDFHRALELVPAGLSPAVRAEILLFAARCDQRAPRAYADEALALARQVGDVRAEAKALVTLAMFLADAGQQAATGSEPIELIARGRALAERMGAHDLLRTAAVSESHLLEGAGEHELAAAAARRGIASAEEHGLLRTTGALLAINQAEPLYALGRWDAAAEVIGRALDLSPTPINRALLEVIRGQIALARGVLGVAREAAAAARAVLAGVAYEDQHQLPLARLEIDMGAAEDSPGSGPTAALTVTGQVLDRFELSRGCPRYAWPVVVAGANAVLAAARQAGAARDERLGGQAAAVADRLRTVAEKLETSGTQQRAYRLTFTAADGHARCLLEASVHGAQRAAGDQAGPRAAWDSAADAWAAVSEPYSLAQALLHAAEAALADGSRDGAAQRLQRAAVLAGKLRALPLGGQIALLARRARIRLADDAASQPEGGTGGPGLTDRELEVLRLVAAGHSNREIAAELFISPKTASVHVSNILGKLGAATRGEAAAKAHALRLLEPPAGTASA